MKKLTVLAILCVLVTGFAAAGGIEFHLGAGYHSSYIGKLPSDAPSGLKTLKYMPLGVGGYAGLGYGFIGNNFLSLGLEFAPSWDLALNPLGTSNLNYQGRGFVKLKPAGILTATAFAGYAGNFIKARNVKAFNKFNPVVGVRVTALMLYAEYAAVLHTNWSGIYKNEVGFGFAIMK